MIEWVLPHAFSQTSEAYGAQAKAFAPWMPMATELWGGSLFFIGPNSAAVIAQWERAKAKVQELAALENDWDGYGAAAIGKAALTNALHAIDILASVRFAIPTPEIAPSSAGTISLVWDYGQRDACIEIGNSRYSGYIRVGSQEPVFLEGQADAIDAQLFWPIASSILPPSSGVSTIANIRIHKDVSDVRLAA